MLFSEGTQLSSPWYCFGAITLALSIASCDSASTNSAASGAGSGNSNVPQQGAANPSNQAPTIAGEPIRLIVAGTPYNFTPLTADLDGDSLIHTASNLPGWASVDPATGTLSGLPDWQDVGATQGVILSVSDGTSTVALSAFDIEVTMDEVELALVSGDASVIGSHATLEQATLDAMDAAGNLHRDVLQDLYELDRNGLAMSNGTSLTAISWNPTHDSARLGATSGENVGVLQTNSVFVDGYSIAKVDLGVLGMREHRDSGLPDTRYLVLGGHPMRNHHRSATALNDEMHRFLESSIGWLTNRNDLATKPFNVTIAQQGQSYYFPDEVAVRSWLQERFPEQATFNEANACDGAALSACVATRPDLLIISQHVNEADDAEPAMAGVRQAIAQGTPVLYLHYDGGLTDLGRAVFKELDVRYIGDNYWHKLQIEAFDPRPELTAVSPSLMSLRTMVQHFLDGSFDIDWSACDEENCSSVASLNEQFMDGASDVRRTFRALDSARINRFSTDRFRLQKLLALLGDRYRAEASYPMDRVTTPDLSFLRALYADHAQYQFRDKVGLWGDLGNFARDDYSHITPVSRSVLMNSKRSFRSTGAYALPGRTVTATRRDTSDVSVSLFVNTIRDGATHLFADDGYVRPRFLRGAAMPIEPGETIRFTSATGGPIQLSFSANDLPVDIVFDEVGEHPHWRSVEDDQRFEAGLAANDFDWAEIASPSFEVHSTHDRMLNSMQDAALGDRKGSAQALVESIMQYVHNHPHVLAGFQGPGIDTVDQIHQFAADNGLDVQTLDVVKHMNADQATCGYGCSGNPYDAYWSFSPIGHGDIHELGHGLERSRFRFSGWVGHSSTNYYSYYTKSQYFKETGGDPSCQSLPFEGSYETLRESLKQADPATYVQANLWDGQSWSTGAAMMIQTMMASEAAGSLEDGWHMLARLHLIEREYRGALNDDADWYAVRAGLGMSQYDRDAARALSSNDWLLIALSQASGLDMRDWLDLWALPYGDSAAAQVAALSLPMMPRNYFVTSAEGFCRGEGFDGRSVALDGSDAAWPLP